MGDNSNLAVGFRDVDRNPAAQSAVRFLDEVNTQKQVQAVQLLSYEQLAVSPGARILDAGCGVGDVSRDMAGLVGPFGKVVGIDVSETMVAESRKRAEGTGLPVEYHQADIHQMDFPSESFDACRASRVFIYLDDPRKALGELLRLTKPGGRVVVVEPDLDSWVLDGPDRAVVRKLIHFWSDQLRSPWIGRKLPGMFHSMGATDILSIPMVASWSVKTLETFGLRSVLEKAIQAQVLTRAQADEWLLYLENAARDGTFFGAMTGMVIRAVKPA